MREYRMAGGANGGASRRDLVDPEIRVDGEPPRVSWIPEVRPTRREQVLGHREAVVNHLGGRGRSRRKKCGAQDQSRDDPRLWNGEGRGRFGGETGTGVR